MVKEVQLLDINHPITEKICDKEWYNYFSETTNLLNFVSKGTLTTNDHTNLINIGTNTHPQLDSHVASGNIHFVEASIDHENIQNIGTNTHPELDSHVANGLIHFIEGDISHLNIQDIGTNAHSVIDTHLASSSNPHTVTLEQARTAGNQYAGDVDYNDKSIIDINTINFKDGGSMSWNPTDKTVDIDTGISPVLQAGFEDWFWAYNDTGVEIPNGCVVHPIDAATDGRPHIEKAIANTHSGIDRAIWVTTMDIPIGESGIVTQRGNVRGFDTSMFNAGDNLWVSATVAGEMVTTAPSFPNYVIQVGGVAISDVSGEIVVSVEGDVSDTTTNFWNGVIRESFDFRTSSDGLTITGSLEPSDGHPDLTMMFSDGFTTLDTDPAITITLTAGTDTNPQTNYVYIPFSTKVLTVSTSGFPTDEHIRIAQLYLQSASQTQLEGALRNQNINEHIEDTNTNQGHLSHIGQRIRAMVAEWNTGAEASLSGTPANVYISNTSGTVYQMHLQTFPAEDMSTGDEINVVNDPVSPYRSTTNLNDITVDANGDTLNNKYFSIVVWGVCNKTGEVSHIMCNLPSGSYTVSEENAVSDALGYSVYTIPTEFKGVGFLMGRFTMRKSGTNFTYNSSTGYQDLRGFIPNSTAGSGAGSSGITTFTGLIDTPSSYIGEANKVATVNSGETALEFVHDITDYFNKTTDDTDDITDTATNRFTNDTDITRLANTSGTNTGDNATNTTYDSRVTANDAKITNATHTGEVTGSGALTLDKTAISNQVDTVITASDTLLFGDATDTDALKKDTVQGLLDLVPATTPGGVDGDLQINDGGAFGTIDGINLDKTGNARGTIALDIQSCRSDVTQVASGLCSMAYGSCNIASGSYSQAYGTKNQSAGSCTLTYGICNYATGTKGIAIGFGTEVTSRCATALGICSCGTGSASSAIGYQNEALSNSASAFGRANIASGASSSSFGYSNTASGATSTAIGFANNAGGCASVTIGSSQVAFSDANIRVGSPSSYFNMNQTGFSVNNMNAISGFHVTSDLLVTDISSLGAEKVTNGDFNGSSTGWTLGGTGWEYFAFKMQKQVDGVGTLSQDVSAVAGEYYWVKISTMNINVGTIDISLGGSSTETLNAATGIWEGVIQAVNTGDLIFTASDLSRVAVLDNVSVKQITGGDVVAPLGNIGGATFSVGGVAGIDFSGAVTNLTVCNGLVISAS